MQSMKDSYLFFFFSIVKPHLGREYCCPNHHLSYPNILTPMESLSLEELFLCTSLLYVIELFG